MSLGSGAAVSAAVFDVTIGGGGNPHFQVTVPASATITSGANTMTVDTFVHIAASGPPFQLAPFTLLVGATLNVGANQAPGTYVGTFSITVTQPIRPLDRASGVLTSGKGLSAGDRLLNSARDGVRGRSDDPAMPYILFTLD